MRERSSSYCLDWHTGNNNLYWGGCHDGWNQKFFWENTAQTAQGWADYCNAYPDLKNAFCGGGTCTTANWWACRTHCYQYGYYEARPVGHTVGVSCGGQYAGPKPESLGTAMRMLSPYRGGEAYCADIHYGNGGTWYMYPCHDGSNQKFYWDTQ